MQSPQIQSEVEVILNGIQNLDQKQQRIALYKLIYQTHPVITTGPFVSTSIDILGISIYFLIARWLLGV